MNIYEQILVVILSSALVVFLVMGIILTALLIKLTKAVNRITEKAESLANKAEAVGDFFEHAAAPMALGRALATVVEKFMSSKHSKRKG